MKKRISLEHTIKKVHANPQYKKVNEDFEHEMARNELETAHRAIKRLMKHLGGEGDIEAWVQSKITKGSDYLDTVADYMDSQKKTDEVEEAVGLGGVSKFKGSEFIGSARSETKKMRAEESEPEGTKYRTSLAAAVVGRPQQGREKLAKQAEIKVKIIDEQKRLAIKVKDVIKKKKENEFAETESGETKIDFAPKLKKTTSE
jgi:hypothetical protein